MLVRMQAVHPGRQRAVLSALRTLLHANVVEFDPRATQMGPRLDLEPRIVGYDAVHYALFELQSPPEEPLPFQVVTQQILEAAAAEPMNVLREITMPVPPATLHEYVCR